MKGSQRILPALSLLMGFSLFPVAVCAQDPQSGAPPKPAAKESLPIGSGDDQQANQASDTVQPDDRPLTGFQQLTTGTRPETHSYWIPGISFTNFIQSNALAQGGTSGWASTSFVTGNLSLSENWRASQLALNYSGGGSFSSDAAIGSGQFHQFGGVQTFNGRRWQLVILDQFEYLPESLFGFGAGAGIANPGVGGALAVTQPGLQSGFDPSQSIFTAVGPRYFNTSGTQVSYLLTPRNSVTFGGVFAILRFTDPMNIESNDTILNAGYSYQLSRTDSLGVSYGFSAFHYLNSPQAIGIHVLQGVYGKKITGRLAFKLSGGPEITNFRVPLGAGPKTQYISGTGTASLTYAYLAGSLSLNYLYGVNNGSGIFLGATSDQVTGSASRRLSRVWTGNASLGYARNGSVAGVAGPTGAQNGTYNSVYIGAGLERPLSRSADFTLSYTANIQTSSNTVCAGPNCATNFTTHEIIVGFGWHARPFVLR
jgi:hypothetical protein